MAGEVVIATLDAQPLRATFPLHVELFGVPAVVIPAAEYEELRALRDGKRAKTFRLSRFDQDEEVRAFVAERLGRVPQNTILAEVRDRFGAKRAPSATGLSRFAAAIRAREGKREMGQGRP